ncbi:MAG: hypothetical protein EKK36_11545 [Bradyrhizobiaceae bacterium]|nr:MAG: hypothetical protein EKK36_11545 [Bradyrhizobiaceae bacterium]
MEAPGNWRLRRALRARHEIDGLHQFLEWALLIVVGIHVGAAIIHLLVYRDRVMQRMWPGEPS